MLQKAYGWRPGGLWDTDPLYMRQGGAVYYYHNDHLGTPQRLSDAGGNVVWSAGYQAFGLAVVDPASTVENNLRFPGQYFDADTGLHYNWHRMYDPQTGRYTQVDPIRFAGGDGNVYRYVFSNVVNFHDSLGLWTFGFDFSVTAGFGGGATAGYTIAIDSNWTVGIVRHSGGGGYGGVGAAGAAQFQVTNAPSIDDLGGFSSSIGGSVLLGTGEFIIMDNGYMGGQIGFGGGPGLPIELHGMVEYGDIVYKKNIHDLLSDYVDGALSDIADYVGFPEQS